MRLVHRPSDPCTCIWRSHVYTCVYFTFIIPPVGVSWFLAMLLTPVARSSSRPESW